MTTKNPGDGWPDDIVFDDDFVRAAPVQESAPLPKPSRESLREVKREAKERQRAARRPKKAAKPPKPAKVRVRRGERLSRARPWLVTIPALAMVVAAYAYFGTNEPVVPTELTGVDASPAGVWTEHSASLWPSAEDGLELPTASALGPYSASDVRRALVAARTFVEAVTIDRRVLFHGSVSPVVNAIEDGDEIRAYYGDPATGEYWPYLVTRFVPKMLGPADGTIKYRGAMKPALKKGTLTVDFSYATVYALVNRKKGANPEIVIVRREGTLDFLQAQPGSVGLPTSGKMFHVSDHSACRSRWPYPAFTQAWVGVDPDPQTSPSDDETLDPNERHDLTNPDDSIRKIHSCFTNTSSDR